MIPPKKRKTRLVRTYHSLFKRDGVICHLCGYPIGREYNGKKTCEDPLRVTIDHIIPKSKGGHNRMDNLKLAHSSCNARRGDMDVDEYILQEAMR